MHDACFLAGVLLLPLFFFFVFTLARSVGVEYLNIVYSVCAVGAENLFIVKKHINILLSVALR